MKDYGAVDEHTSDIAGIYRYLISYNLLFR